MEPERSSASCSPVGVPAAERAGRAGGATSPGAKCARCGLLDPARSVSRSLVRVVRGRRDPRAPAPLAYLTCNAEALRTPRHLGPARSFEGDPAVRRGSRRPSWWRRDSRIYGRPGRWAPLPSKLCCALSAPPELRKRFPSKTSVTPSSSQITVGRGFQQRLARRDRVRSPHLRKLSRRGSGGRGFVRSASTSAARDIVRARAAQRAARAVPRVRLSVRRRRAPQT